MSLPAKNLWSAPIALKEAYILGLMWSGRHLLLVPPKPSSSFQPHSHFLFFSHVLKHFSPTGWFSSLPLISQISVQGHFFRYLSISIGLLHTHNIVSFLAITLVNFHFIYVVIWLVFTTWLKFQVPLALEFNASIICWMNDWIGLVLIYSYVSVQSVPGLCLEIRSIAPIVI